MKYREYNKIIKDYADLEKECRAKGNAYAANACKTIIEDLKMLLKQGILGKFPSKKEKK